MAASAWIRHGSGARPCMEAFFPGLAYAPHRHQDYVFALTLGGVQQFHYRGFACASLPGQVVVLHPDELHDGQAGTDAGFRYRAVAVAPDEIQAVLAGRPLPFLVQGVTDDPALSRAVEALVSEVDALLEPMARETALASLADRMAALSGDRPSQGVRDFRAASMARDMIRAHDRATLRLADLEKATGRDRWRLSRDFRAYFGCSPYRYWTARRLDRAIAMMRTGADLADVAAASGFADQSHFGRCFRAAIGMSPRAWMRAAAAS